MKARVFGAGSIGNHITNALRNIDYEIEVVDIDKTALSRMKNEIYPSRYKEWDESINLLVSPSEDIVDLEVIGTPPDTHTKILSEGLSKNRARKWLVEKPFTYPDSEHISFLKKNLKGLENRIFVGYNHSVTPAFINFLKEIKYSKNITRIYCNWLENWGGIFKAHPWLNGPEDSYLGFSKRGGGSLMEHSHGLHLLLLVFEHLGLKIDKINSCLNMDSKNNYDKYVNIAFELESKSKNIIASYTTDVLTKDICKKIVLEADDKIFSVEFGAKNGSCDIFKKSSYKEDIEKYYYKNRPDDFKYEIALLNDSLIGGKNENISNLCYTWGLEVSDLCSKILNNKE